MSDYELFCMLASDDELVNIILDPSNVAGDEDDAVYLECQTRHACYTLHNRRAVIEWRVSMYQWSYHEAKHLQNG